MANRLNKLALITYTPAVPYRPYQPAYCTTRSYRVPARYVVTGYAVITGVDAFGNRFTFYAPRYTLAPARTEYEKVCYPAVPERPAVPAKTTYTAVTGWNSGASSLASLRGDGYVEFEFPANPFGVVVGLSGVDADVSPNEQTHAFYAHARVVDIFEGGRLVASFVHVPGTKYRIARAAGVVRYLIGGAVVHTSANPSLGRVVLDASMYAAGDYVDNPVVRAQNLPGAGSGTLKPLLGIASSGAYSLVTGTLPALTGGGREAPRPSVAHGSLAALIGVAADRPYGSAAGSLAPLEGRVEGGFPQVSVVDGFGIMAALSGYARGTTGTVGSAQGSLGGLTGVAADRPYGAAGGTLAALEGMAEGDLRAPYSATISSSLILLGQVDSDSPVGGTFSSSLKLTSSFAGTLLVQGEFSSTLLFVSTVEAAYRLEAEFSSTLVLEFEAVGATQLAGLDAQLVDEGGQFSVNLDTGAVARYVGYAFDAYAAVGDAVYGSRRTGVYHLRPGDDNGSPIDVRVDFGSSDFGTSAAKNLAYLYLGMDTDGVATVRATTNGVVREYRTRVYGTMLRAKLSGRPEARRWGISMDVLGATVLDLYSLEAVPSVAARRVGS